MMLLLHAHLLLLCGGAILVTTATAIGQRLREQLVKETDASQA